ncbi:hypothetical protein [Brevibacterium aurantiacum]|uniref:Uncharacterized protein n=1 Tax=Brevibacterium aurantiacum TaxID=273384 RepID=A0A556CL31_BREAU|nr:hypothetical protein [Brevibacterium aurantiacum]TSI17788.1 hypothetical protein FO013_06235 [Brevibacterium aurantiacum]
MESTDTWLVFAIIAAEMAFWVLLAFGLCARYLLKLRRTSMVVLVSVPIVDMILIILVACDLARGASPSSIHGLAAVYLGFSVGFGRYIITRADAWFAFRFADAAPPPGVPRAGPEKVNHEWRDWLRVLTAWSVAVPALLLMKLFSGWSLPNSLEHLFTDELWSWVARLTLITVAWLITGPVYASIFKATTVAENVDISSRRELA